MDRSEMALRAGALGVLIAAAGATGAMAQAPEDFYKGRTVTLYIGSGVGGGYDSAGRLVGQHIAGKIPGKPVIVPKNMPGASSVVAAKYFSNVAARDGTSLGFFQPSIVTQRVVDKEKELQPEKFVWLGRLQPAALFGIAWHTSHVKTFEDIKKAEYIVAAPSVTGAGAQVPYAFNRMVGTKFTVVSGYKSSAATGLAMERGEVQGLGSTSYEFIASKDWIKSGQVRFLYALGIERDRRLPDVPSLVELVAAKEDQQVMKLLGVSSTIGRSLAAAPETPADRAAVLRTAFAETVKDKDFIETGRKLSLEVDYLSGEKLEEIVKDVISTPDSVIVRFKEMTKAP